MHVEIINQAREILTQRLYRTDSLTSPRDTESYLALQPGEREQEVSRLSVAIQTNMTKPASTTKKPCKQHTPEFREEALKLAA